MRTPHTRTLTLRTRTLRPLAAGSLESVVGGTITASRTIINGPTLTCQPLTFAPTCATTCQYCTLFG